MKLFNTLAKTALFLTFCVIVIGAYVRLSDAGLGCPDWPGCYGKIVVPENVEQLDEKFRTEYSRELVPEKAWKEMIHRYAASTLGFIILCMALLAWRNRDDPYQPIKLPVVLLGLVIFQGLLGMWTVTLLLKPIIVTLHLMGGMTTLFLLTWLVLEQRKQLVGLVHQEDKKLWPLALIAFICLYTQIFLGGWTSSNYAALICPDFPTCQNHWWPAMDFEEGFTLWRGTGIDYEYGVLNTAGRTAIHMTHRIGALITFTMILVLVFTAVNSRIDRIKQASWLVTLALLLQVSLGIANIRLGLPLPVAAAHNGGAAILLLSMTVLLHSIFKSRR